MKHNKFNLKVGDTVILDADSPNGGEVKIHRFTPNELFASVSEPELSEEDSWQTMTSRLTPVGFQDAKKEAINSFKNNLSKTFIIVCNDKSYTSSDMIKEIENETEVGISQVLGLLSLKIKLKMI